MLPKKDTVKWNAKYSKAFLVFHCLCCAMDGGSHDTVCWSFVKQWFPEESILQILGCFFFQMLGWFMQILGWFTIPRQNNKQTPFTVFTIYHIRTIFEKCLKAASGWHVVSATATCVLSSQQCWLSLAFTHTCLCSVVYLACSMLD